MKGENVRGGIVVQAGAGRSHDFAWGSITWIASGALGNSNEMTFGKVVINSGCSNPKHWHPNSEEVLHLLAGELEHYVGDQAYRLHPGDTIIIPRGVRHYATARGDEDAVMLVAYPTPQREMRVD